MERNRNGRDTIRKMRVGGLLVGVEGDEVDVPAQDLDELPGAIDMECDTARWPGYLLAVLGVGRRRWPISRIPTVLDLGESIQIWLLLDCHENMGIQGLTKIY